MRATTAIAWKYAVSLQAQLRVGGPLAQPPKKGKSAGCTLGGGIRPALSKASLFRSLGRSEGPELGETTDVTMRTLGLLLSSEQASRVFAAMLRHRPGAIITGWTLELRTLQAQACQVGMPR